MVLKRGQGYNCDFPWTFFHTASQLPLCGRIFAFGRAEFRANAHSAGVSPLAAASSASISASASDGEGGLQSLHATGRIFAFGRAEFRANAHSAGVSPLAAASSASISASASDGEGGLQSLHAPRPSKMASRTVSERRLDWLPHTCTA